MKITLCYDAYNRRFEMVDRDPAARLDDGKVYVLTVDAEKSSPAVEPAEQPSAAPLATMRGHGSWRTEYLLVFSFLILSACLPGHARVSPNKEIIERPTWSAVETAPDQFAILARDSGAIQDAIEELCERRYYVCFGPEALGRVVSIERRRK